MSDSWRAANRDYMKFQKMNPIFGNSKITLFKCFKRMSYHIYNAAGISSKD